MNSDLRVGRQHCRAKLNSAGPVGLRDHTLERRQARRDLEQGASSLTAM